ncbi:MAG: hypothetical protein Q7K40_01925 [bacterium]|nr:hypothetical protein [bacterium]
MKKTFISTGALALLLAPAIMFAQSYDSSGGWQNLLYIEDTSKLLELTSLLATLTVAFATIVMVWVGGRKMHGGVFGSILNLFSIGMTLIFIGFVTGIPVFQNFDHLYVKMVHDSLYIIGYVTMGLAASKLLKVIKGE